jgi:hypothetical protein
MEVLDVVHVAAESDMISETCGCLFSLSFMLPGIGIKRTVIVVGHVLK